jgi:hypothetical protein
MLAASKGTTCGFILANKSLIEALVGADCAEAPSDKSKLGIAMQAVATARRKARRNDVATRVSCRFEIRRRV